MVRVGCMGVALVSVVVSPIRVTSFCVVVCPVRIARLTVGRVHSSSVIVSLGASVRGRGVVRVWLGEVVVVHLALVGGDSRRDGEE